MIDYNNYLASKLNELKEDDVNIVVSDEQAFIKLKKLEPNTIYVVIKMLSSIIAYDGKIQPVQLMILSESNSLVIAKNLFTKFAETYNLTSETVGSDLIKQTYETPVVMDNFEQVGYGFNSLLYVSGTLFILESILDLSNLTIDDDEIKITSFHLVYSMTGNTQPVSSDKISTTVKSVSTVNCSFVIPMIGAYSDFIKKVLNIKAGNLSGNTSFNFKFTIADIDFDFDMKLISSEFSTAPNSAPGLTLGFMV